MTDLCFGALPEVSLWGAGSPAAAAVASMSSISCLDAVDILWWYFVDEHLIIIYFGGW